MSFHAQPSFIYSFEREFITLIQIFLIDEPSSNGDPANLFRETAMNEPSSSNVHIYETNVLHWPLEIEIT